MPHGKHALILVKQPKGNLVWISTQDTTNVKVAPSTNEKDKKFEPRLKTWSDCDHIQVIIKLQRTRDLRSVIITATSKGSKIYNKME